MANVVNVANVGSSDSEALSAIASLFAHEDRDGLFGLNRDPLRIPGPIVGAD